ncbi:MAG: hypothetical protein HPY50_08830 [Firmicutes bacterium]|nr:hypothetical protein [Bacillota bacterium]
MIIKINHPIKGKITTSAMRFLKKNVIGVTDLTRNKKLNQILDSYAEGSSSDVYIIQNHKKKNAMAVLTDFDFFEELLSYKEIVEEAIELQMYKTAVDRQRDIADIPLSVVLADEEISYTDILKRVSEVETED